MDGTIKDQREYDLFGPWIDEVRTPEDIPRLYRPHEVDLARTRLVLKVPRNIARRDATPEMDLYDHLLVLDEDARLTVLSRRSDRGRRKGQAAGGAPYDTQQMIASDITGIRTTVSFLDGRLTIHAGTVPALHVRFNGAGRPQIHRLVNELIAAVSAPPRTPLGAALLSASPRYTGAPPRGDLANDLSLISDFTDAVRERPALEACAWHGRRELVTAGGGAAALLHKAVHALRPVMLQGAVLARTEGTLELFTRHDWLLPRADPVHSSSHVVVPLARLEGVSAEPHPRYDGVDVVVLNGGAEPTTLLLPGDSTARALLAAATRAAAPHVRGPAPAVA